MFKKVLVLGDKNDIGIFYDTFSHEGIRQGRDSFGSCKVIIDGNYNRIFSRKKVFPILRHFSEISKEEMDILNGMKFSFDDPEFEDLSPNQFEYIKSIGIDYPLWFGFGHPNNGETAIDLGLAIHISELKEYLFKDEAI